MYTQPGDVAEHIGRPLTDAEAAQVARWIGWLESDILDRVPAVDPDKASRAVVESVAAYMRRPDGATSVQVSVDDGMVSKRYESGSGRVEILPELWAGLGWVERKRGAFTIRPHGSPDAASPRVPVQYRIA